jgi:hypothetical protein
MYIIDGIILILDISFVILLCSTRAHVDFLDNSGVSLG